MRSRTLAPFSGPAALGLAMATTIGCGNSDQQALSLGKDDGGPAFVAGPGNDASVSSLAVSVSPAEAVVCSGACVALRAEASGGQAPYSYDWDGGLSVDGGAALACPSATTTYGVRATDSSGHVGDISSSPLVGTTQVTVTVGCSDAGAPVPGTDVDCDSGGAGTPPESGQYVGTLICGPGSHWYNGVADGGTVVGPDASDPLGTLTLNLTIDPSTAQQSATWYFEWNLQLIAGAGSAQGTLDCSADFRASFVNASWGLAGSNMTVVPTGGLIGMVTAERMPGSTDTITGTFDYSGNPDNGSACFGSYTATLQQGPDL